jgi:phosphoribosylanthranilate isomerase
MRIKICGITKEKQAQEIVNLGISCLGFICVRESARYINPLSILEIVQELNPDIRTIGVFADAPLSIIVETVKISKLTGVQLHGQESVQFCLELKNELPEIELIKAFRVKSRHTLTQIEQYYTLVDTLLLDAYHPQLLGGSGQTIDWQDLRGFSPPLPWLLAGGLNPDNVKNALSQVNPSGIDLSSGVENHPGDKNIEKVKLLLEILNQSSSF